jgi:hypothetical protein
VHQQVRKSFAEAQLLDELARVCLWSEQIRVAASEQRVRTITKLARADITADLLSDGAGAPLALGVASLRLRR